MRVLLFIILILTQINIYSQSKDKFIISGFIKEESSKLAIEECEISIITPSGLIYKSKSDSNGYFKIENILNIDNKFILSFKKGIFFNDELKIYFNNSPNDTVINIELRILPVDVMWLPEIYFKYNKVKPIKNYKESLVELVKTLDANPTLIIKIIGYKDSEETKDLRLERINLIMMKLIKKGIDKKRFEIEISNNPNFKKEDIMKIEYRTRKSIPIILTDEYIKKISSSKDRENLRQLNRCVSFQIIGEL